MSLLVGILVVVAVVAWACSTGGDGPRRNNATGATAGGEPKADPVLDQLPSARPAPSPSPSPTVARTATARPAPARPRRPGQPCERKELVLSLRTQQEVYQGSARPSFVYTLVNTGSVMCTADVGPRAIEFRITSGKDRIWSTADCVSGTGEQVERLERGVPYVRSVSWDRRRSGASCAGTRAAALPGTYVAVVDSGTVRSRKTVFHLR